MLKKHARTWIGIVYIMKIIFNLFTSLNFTVEKGEVIKRKVQDEVSAIFDGFDFGFGCGLCSRKSGRPWRYLIRYYFINMLFFDVLKCIFNISRLRTEIFLLPQPTQMVQNYLHLERICWGNLQSVCLWLHLMDFIFNIQKLQISKYKLNS